VEAAWQAAEAGVKVRIFEMRPVQQTPAHRTDKLAEIVCSNSLKTDEPGTAPYLLKEELRRGGSLVLEAAVATRVPRLELLPATVDLSGAEIELVELADRAHRLDKAFAAEPPGRWDIALIDCPPSLGLLTVNALVAARHLLVPLQCEFFALEGLSQLLQTVERIRAAFNTQLSILGVALTMFDRRNNLSAAVAEDVRACLGPTVFETVVPRNVRLSEAPSHGLPALIYDLRCPGSEAYIRLARELLGRLPALAEAA